MRPRTVLILLLIVASVLVDLAALEFASNHRDMPVATAFLASLAVSQTALVSIWAGLGKTWVFLRLTAVLGVCWLWNRQLGARGWALPDGWLIVLVVESALIVVGLCLWRANGLRGVDFAGRLPATESRRNGPPQFRIVDFLGATFVLAVLLAMIRPVAIVRHDWPLLLIAATATATLATLLAWLTLRRNEAFSRLTALAASLAVGGGLGLLATWPHVEPPLDSTMLFLASATMLLVGSLLVIRVAGYRLATARSAPSIAPQRAARSAAAMQ